LSGGPGRTEDEIPQVARFASRLTPGSLASIDHVADLLERCLIADHQLDANAAIPLCVESLCNDLGRMQRT
jgi:hypothetical protein